MIGLKKYKTSWSILLLNIRRIMGLCEITPLCLFTMSIIHNIFLDFTDKCSLEFVLSGSRGLLLVVLWITTCLKFFKSKDKLPLVCVIRSKKTLIRRLDRMRGAVLADVRMC